MLEFCYTTVMEHLIDSYKKWAHLHHAYFLIGEGEVILPKLKDFLEKSVGLKTTGNPDFWYGQYKTFTIEQARQIADAQERKSFTSNVSKAGFDTSILKIFVISAEIITEEAQNALLKIFEEPTSGTHFFIILPQDILLPTLRSRMQIIQGKTLNSKQNEKQLGGLTSQSTSQSIKAGFDILGMKIKERLAKVKGITDAISDENKTKQDAIVLLNQIEIELHSKGILKFAKALKVCELARASLYDRGAPVKMILENVMLSI